MNISRYIKLWSVAVAVSLSLLVPAGAFAHCDTLDGPVVAAARKALETGDPVPLLRWVQKDDEGVIRDALKRAVAVRAQGGAAKDLADTWFFETVVRIHRAGEGVPFTGLKPAGTEVEPGIQAADAAVDKGDVDGVVKDLTAAVASGIKARFAGVIAAKKHADESVEAGREYVEAYVEFIHYVERLHVDAGGAAHHGGEAPEAAHGKGHQAH